MTLVHAQQFGCLVCPVDAEGYFGFETADAKAMSRHLQEQHEITGPYRRVLKAAIDMARGEYQNNYEWFHREGTTPILMQRCTGAWQKDAVPARRR